MSHFNVSFIVRVKSQDSVHQPPFLKRKESRSGLNGGLSADQPSALPLGHTGSRAIRSPVHFLYRVISYPLKHRPSQPPEKGPAGSWRGCRNKYLLFLESRAIDSSLFGAWSGLEYSFERFDYCRESCRYHICLCGYFSFFVSLARLDSSVRI